MKKTAETVTFVSYLHSGAGYISVTLRNSTRRRDFLDFLKDLERIDPDSLKLTMQLDGISFSATIASITSRKTCVILTVHTKPTRFLVNRFFDMTGRTLTLEMSAYGWNSRLASDKDDEDVKRKVSGLLTRLSKKTGDAPEEIIYKETTFTGKDGKTVRGVRTLDGMKTKRLKFLERRLSKMMGKQCI